MSQLWAEPDDPNPATALGGYVASGAPLVAGFELAAVVLLLTSDNVAQHVPLAGPAVLAMVISVLLMVFSIRYGFWAVSYWTTPDERTMWHPAAYVDDTSLNRERRMLAGRLAYFRVLRNRSEHLFQLGIMIFLVGIALMLVPHHWHADGSAWRWAAVWAAALAFLVHVLWTTGSWLHGHMGGWRRYCQERRKKDKDAWDRVAGLLKTADVRLVKYLAVIWPPAKPPPGYQEPGNAQQADLDGLRRP